MESLISPKETKTPRVAAIQAVLDKHCLAGVNLSPPRRSKPNEVMFVVPVFPSSTDTSLTEIFGASSLRIVHTPCESAIVAFVAPLRFTENVSFGSLVVSPFTREHFERSGGPAPGLSPEPSLVVYDDLGGGVGQTIGYVEGREAAQPFDEPTPVDAINVALVDQISYQPSNR